MGETHKRVEMAPFCCVCGDLQHTNCYGNYLCRGCFDFFKRSLEEKRKYKCEFKGECKITKENRTKCRYCRMKKCLDNGIRRDIWEENKKRYGKNFKKKNTQNKSSNKISEIKTPLVSLINTRDKRTKTDFSEEDGNRNKLIINSPTQIIPQPENSILDDLIEIENIMQHPRKWHCHNSRVFFEIVGDNGEIVYSGGVLKPLKKMLKCTIKWTEAIGKLANLQINDKILLSEEFACKNIILCLMGREMDNEGYIYVIGEKIDKKYGESDDKKTLDKFFGRKLKELVDKMTRLRLTFEEFIIIKATLFLESDTDGLSNSGSSCVLELKESVLECFITCKDNDSSIRLSRLCDILCSVSPLLRTLSKMMIKCRTLRDVFSLDDAGTLIQQYIGEPSVISEDEINEGIITEDDFMDYI
uniref:Nuclear receptor domain-containing protein n=1 Tax=Strongyloides papillosus TaxID=174720 RepID=A0A0N5B611_STREA